MRWYDVFMGIFLNANRGFYEHYHHTHLQPINPPQSNFPSGPSEMYPKCINPHPHTSASSFHSQNPSPSCSRNTCSSPFNQYNNSLLSLSQSYPKASILSAKTSSEEDINLYPTNAPSPFKSASDERTKSFKCPVQSCRGLEL